MIKTFWIRILEHTTFSWYKAGEEYEVFETPEAYVLKKDGTTKLSKYICEIIMPKDFEDAVNQLRELADKGYIMNVYKQGEAYRIRISDVGAAYKEPSLLLTIKSAFEAISKANNQ